MKKRWRYYIDKEFQNQFIYKFSLLIILCAILTLGLLWMIRKESYNLLPENAPVLVHVDTNKGVYLSFEEEKVVVDEEHGKLYFPLKVNDGKAPKLYSAFDLYLIPILASSLLNIIIVSLFSIFFSHKMAGPIKRIKNTLEAHNNHKPVNMIKLRKGDFFQDLAELINKAFLAKTDKGK
jgi:hypothetical protein